MTEGKHPGWARSELVPNRERDARKDRGDEENRFHVEPAFLSGAMHLAGFMVVAASIRIGIDAQ
jgi:hypothetical protein